MLHLSNCTVSDLSLPVYTGGASVLFMGRPGVGITTAICELSRLMATDVPAHLTQCK
jgi:stage III sporulation protein SpoIIIAA